MRRGSNKKSGGGRNDQRKNGKAWKKNPKSNRSRGKTIGGYSPKALERRKQKRQNLNLSQSDVLADNGGSVGENVTSANS